MSSENEKERDTRTTKPKIRSKTDKEKEEEKEELEIFDVESTLEVGRKWWLRNYLCRLSIHKISHYSCSLITIEEYQSFLALI